MYSQAGATGLHASAMSACEASGFVPEVKQEANQISTVLALVESGLGVALVPEVVRGQRDPHVIYRDIEIGNQGVETTLALAFHPDSESPAAQRFIEVSKAFRSNEINR